MINHRYHIVRKLGEGGSGEVFLVEDTLKRNRRSAMKILHLEDPTDGLAAGQFQREVSILATLHHPNLVRVFDFGVVRRADNTSLHGRRFLTMEYVHGVTAGDWCRHLKPDADRAGSLLHIVVQALAVLSYIHRAGIIHFDVKPDNLLLLSRGEADQDLPLLKLTDFGFSTTKGATHDFPLRGTLEYTAPELLRREQFDHRIDLYSFGATLYQLIESRCPFEASDPVELIKTVLTAEPAFHQSAAVPYSPFLPLLQGLLAKDPSRRFRTAGEAARVLPTQREQAPGALSDRVEKPGFVGRDAEKRQIGTLISSLGREQTGQREVAMLILGPEGIGKTALLAELVRSARASDIPVLETSDSQGDVPFGAVLSLLGILRAEILTRVPDGAELVERFADVIAWPGQTGGEASRNPHAEWMLDREKTVESQGRFLTQASDLFPLMVVADDVDRLDAESRDVLKLVARDARPGRMLLLLAERQESGVSAAATRLPLEELDPASVDAMSASTLTPAEVGAAIGSRLYELYGGTPSTIVEALHCAGKLLQSACGADATDSGSLAERVIGRLPRDLDQFLLDRYTSLDRERQLVLEILSSFARPARTDVLQASLPFRPGRTEAYLSALEADGLIVSQDGGQRFSIRQARLKSLISATLHETRLEVHRFIASALEQVSDARAFVDLQELAHQYRSGEQTAAAIPWLEAAADEGMELAAYRRAKELYEEAVSLFPDRNTPDCTRLRLKLARSLLHSGSFREAAGLATSLLGEQHPGRGEETELHKTAGLALSRLGEYKEGRHHITAALQSCANGLDRVELVQEMAGIDIALGNFLDAERASLTHLDEARGVGTPRMIASIYTDLGIATFYQEQFDRSVGYFQEAMKISADARQQARVADAMMNIGNVMSARGDVPRAVEYWKEALAISREFGTLNQQGQIHNNLGIAHYGLKRFEEARQFYDNAKAIFGRLESKQGSAFVLTNLGEVHFAEGRYEQALLLWEDARKLYCEMEDERGIVETMLQLAQVHLVLGAGASAAGDLDAADALTRKKDLENFRPRLLSLRGMHLMSIDDYAGARRLFGQAEECTREGGDRGERLLLQVRIAECEYRLENHAAAVAAARAALELGEGETRPAVAAGACLLLGRVAKTSPSSISEKALPLFRRGLEAIAGEPVSEMTWKLALALGQEFWERGQRERAKEFLLQAKVVLRFFLEQFSSPGLKHQYLAAEGRDRAVAVLEQLLKA